MKWSQALFASFGFFLLHDSEVGLRACLGCAGLRCGEQNGSRLGKCIDFITEIRWYLESFAQLFDATGFRLAIEAEGSPWATGLSLDGRFCGGVYAFKHHEYTVRYRGVGVSDANWRLSNEYAIAVDIDRAVTSTEEEIDGAGRAPLRFPDGFTNEFSCWF